MTDRSGLRKKVLSGIAALMMVKIAFFIMPWSLYGPDKGAVTTAHAQARPAKDGSKNIEPSDPAELAPAPTTIEPAPDKLEGEILREVKQRQEELDKKEDELAIREEQLRTMKSDLDKQISQLKALQASIEEQIKLRTDLETKAIIKLAKTYSAMPPDNAASLIQKIDTSIAIRVLGAMKERSAGRILAALPPDKASKLSEGLVKKGKNR